MRRRIINEQRKWENQFNNKNQLLVLDNVDSSCNVCLFFCDVGYYKNILIKIIIPDEYPFRPPKIYFCKNHEDTNYKQILMMGTFFRNELETIAGKGICLCCRTITCNWGPINNIMDIANEIKENLLLKQKIMSRIHLRKLKNKCYNNITSDDIWEYILEFI